MIIHIFIYRVALVIIDAIIKRLNTHLKRISFMNYHIGKKIMNYSISFECIMSFRKKIHTAIAN